MVSQSPQLNFHQVIDEFVSLKQWSGPHAAMLQQFLRARASELLTPETVRYMPTFKILDLLAAMVNFTHDVAEEGQLRPQEATALLRAHLSDHAPFTRQFLLDAALERARYEPMMITDSAETSHRNVILRKRWHAMLEAHQEHQTLPSSWEAVLTESAEQVILAPCFDAYRQGPLMQLFAEMLQTARRLHDEGADQLQLLAAIDRHSPLWKRYALKSARYRDTARKAGGLLPHHAQVPLPPGSSQLH